MTLTFGVRPVPASRRNPLLFAAIALAAAVAGCAQEPPKPTPVALAPPPPPPPAPPVTLSARVVEAASVYRAYVRRVSQISPSFTTGPQVEDSLTSAEGYEAQQLARGMVAYGALAALQDPAFVSSVRTYAVDPDGRRALAERIVADPYYVAALPGAATAAGLVISTLNGDSARLRRAGELIKQFAYDVQRQPWSKRDVTDPQGRLARAKSASAAAMTPAPEDVEALKAAVNGADPKVAPKTLAVSGEASAPPYTPVVSRALAVAALAALGEGGDDHDAQVVALLSEPSGGFCLNMSKLNLYQCLAVARPWYEDVFCLGQHVLIDTSQCITKDAGVSRPAQLATSPAGGTSGTSPAP